MFNSAVVLNNQIYLYILLKMIIVCKKKYGEHDMFIKHGDGKIISVIDEEELSEEQKKSMKNLSKEQIKTSEERKDSDASSKEKKSGS